MKHYFIKPTYCLFLTGLILLLLSGCADEDNPGGTAGIVPADISAGIHTRASNTEWDANDAIGITMVKAGTHTIAENTTNRLYKTDASGSGKFTADASQQIYFPQDGTEVNFKSYYPYKSDLAADHFIPVDVSDQNNLPEIDLMTAEHLTGFSKESPHVSLNFHHRLTKLTFNINVEENSSQYALENATLTIRGMKTTATYDLFNEQLTDVDNPGLIHVPAGDDAANRTAIVLPREAGDGVSFTIQFPNGENYTALLKEDLELKAGFHYQFSLQLKKNELVISVTIEDWEDGGSFSKVFTINTTVADNQNVEVGDVLQLYILDEENNQFTHLTNFTYTIEDTWNPDEPIYWSNLSGEQRTFRAIIKKADRHNNSQLDDIVASGDVIVAKNQPAEFVLKRVASQVIVKLKSTDGFFSEEELKKMTVELPFYDTDGEMVEGEFIPGRITGTIYMQQSEDKNSFIALIQPQKREDDELAAIIRYGNSEYLARFTEAIEFQAGVSRLLEIDMNQTAIVIGVKIIDWQNGDPVSLSAALKITGQLDGNDDFFEDKKIYIYEITPTDYIKDFYEYTYEKLGSTNNYEWTGKTVYWENTDNLQIKLSAGYYPSQTPSLSNIKSSFTWEIEANQKNGYEKWDLLWSKRKIYTTEYVNLQFEHALSKIVIKLEPGEGFDAQDLATAEVTILNPALTGTVDIVSHSISNQTGNSNVTPYKEIEARTFSCLVMPQTIQHTNDFISVKLPGYNESFVGKLKNNLQLESGKQHEITVEINRTKIEMNATLKDWEDGSKGNVTIQ